MGVYYTLLAKENEFRIKEDWNSATIDGNITVSEISF